MVEVMTLPLGTSQHPLQVCTCLPSSAVLLQTNGLTLKLFVMTDCYRDQHTRVKTL
ncbi:hypothetical protein DPMN_175188 [Dreissena polymorpha]|uniref:Uncharacterized protein n=1 Tax=Dreissena polymorpha TaxID=45954 RepID=A0A9D4E6S5_DREPO|nr:hypothetical protein DPMN_175188 [Dreissena polymorpha]